MEKNITMLAKDAVSARMAKCYVKFSNGNRYNLMNAKNVEAKLTRTKTKVSILGRMMKGNKTTGLEGTGKATFYYNTSVFRKAMKDYKELGQDFYFDIEITNEDPTSSVGRQTIKLVNCNLDDMILVKFDVDSDDPLEEEINFTFEDWEMPEEFKLLDGMEA